MTCIFEGCDIFILPIVFTVACRYVTVKYRNKTKQTERPMLPPMNQFSSLFTIKKLAFVTPILSVVDELAIFMRLF